MIKDEIIDDLDDLDIVSICLDMTIQFSRRKL